LVVNWFTKKK